MKKKVLITVIVLVTIFAGCSFAVETAPEPFNIETVRKGGSYNDKEIARFTLDYFHKLIIARKECSMAPVAAFVEGEAIDQTKSIIEESVTARRVGNGSTLLMPIKILRMNYDSQQQLVRVVVWVKKAKQDSNGHYEALSDSVYECGINTTGPYKINKVATANYFLISGACLPEFDDKGAVRLQTAQTAPLCARANDNSKIISVPRNTVFAATKQKNVNGREWIWGQAIFHGKYSGRWWGWIPAEYLVR